MNDNNSNTTNKTKNPELFIVLPAFNEERFIGSLVIKLREYADGVVVVDDGSTDMTALIASVAGATVERHEQNKGKGAALTTGFRKALEMGADIVVMIDADGQHSPADIDTIIAPIEAGEADIVIGSRYLEQRSEVPTHRVWGHRLFTSLTNWTSGISVTDSQSGYRAFSAKALKVFSFYSEGFSVESEMQFIASEHNLRLIEVPITISYDDEPKRSVIKQGIWVLNGILYMISQYRPLLFFSTFGLISFLIGVGWGIKVVNTFYSTQQLALGSAVVSAIFVTIGAVSLSTGIILHSMRSMLTNILTALKNQ